MGVYGTRLLSQMAWGEVGRVWGPVYVHTHAYLKPGACIRMGTSLLRSSKAVVALDWPFPGPEESWSKGK